MSPEEQNAILTDVSPGTPMHEAFRRYWLPALLSRDLPEPDSDPKRVTLLDRSYVAFRDSEGRVGLLDEHCCHRSASLCLGRVEGGGIRCIYHGWKYDVDGVVMDMPNVSDERIKARIRQGAYPVREVGGIIWVYLGPKELEPPLPHLAMFDVPEEHRFCEIVVSSVNYTQMVEGVLDSSHVGVLHHDVASPEIRADPSPDLEVEDTDFGFRYCAMRAAVGADGSPEIYGRVSTFAFPSSVYVNHTGILLIAVPITTSRAQFVMIFWDEEKPIGVGQDRENLRAYFGIDDEGMTNWGLHRDTHDLPTSPNRANNYKQNRERMRSGESFSGMHQFIPEDFGVAQSMGAVLDRTKEHLVPADRAIAKYRRLMIENAQAIANGAEPAGLNPARPPRAMNGMMKSREEWKSWFANPDS